MSAVNYRQMYHFVSMVSDTATATFIPLMGYRLKFGDPLSVILFVTPKVEDLLEGLLKQIKKMFPHIMVSLISIPSGRESLRPHQTEVGDNFQQLEEKYGPLAINMMGGMKRTIFSGLFALKNRDHLFMEITEGGFHLFHINEGQVLSETGSIPEELPIEDLLAMQGIEYQSINRPRFDLRQLARNVGADYPANGLYNVAINGCRVECLWNSGNNTISVLLAAQNCFDSVKKSEDISNYILNVGLKKIWAGHIFKRKVYVLDCIRGHIQKYLRLGAGKIKPFLFDWTKEKTAPMGLKQVLEEIFSPADYFITNKQYPPVLFEINKPTLICFVGRPGAVTPLVIASHKCPDVILYYTVDDPKVSEMAQSIAANAQKLGVKNVTLIPSDYRGANVQIPLDEKSARLAEVNLSPGTKSQCSSLALWALNRNIPAYVLENFKIVGFGDNTPTRPLVDLKPEIRQIFFGKQ